MSAHFIALLAVGAVLIGLELYGVARRPGGHSGGRDTISELYWVVRRRFGWKVHLPLVAFLGWLAVHLVWGG